VRVQWEIRKHARSMIKDSNSGHGMIVMRMRKSLRQCEEEPCQQALMKLGTPVLCSITSQEQLRVETASGLTLAVGQVFRSNAARIKQIHEILRPWGMNALPYHLPYCKGAHACLHLLSLISVVQSSGELDLRNQQPLRNEPCWQFTNPFCMCRSSTARCRL
jgi:hypothetical protein